VRRSSSAILSEYIVFIIDGCAATGSCFTVIVDVVSATAVPTPTRLGRVREVLFLRSLFAAPDDPETLLWVLSFVNTNKVGSCVP
jgi:hypothetical protein